MSDPTASWLVVLKWAIALGAVALVPLAARVLRRRPDWTPWAVLLLGLLPFAGIERLAINPISFATYRGDARGLELTAADLIAWTLLLALPRGAPTPWRIPRYLYLAIAALSIFAAEIPLFSVFSVWRLIRCYAALAAAFRACEHPRLAPWLLRGLAAGVVLQAAVVTFQHYALHRYQASGWFPHQNLLTMTCNLIAPVALAVLLSQPGRRLAVGAVLGALLCVLFGLSRGSLLMYAASMGLTLLFALWRGATRRRLAVAALALVLGTGVTLKALPTIVDRFRNAPVASVDGRRAFEQAAWMMLADHPLGIGINQFSWTLEHRGYGERIGYSSGAYDKSGIVHNIYLLNAAELGWAGLFAWLLLIGCPLLAAARGALRGRGTMEGEVLLGCAVAFAAADAQGRMEWIGRQSAFAYVFFILAGLAAALEQRTRKPAPMAAAAHPSAAAPGPRRRLASA